MHFSVPSKSAEKIVKTVKYTRSPSVSVKFIEADKYKYSAVVSKKQGNAAKRNRVKRIIREIMRSRHDVYPSGFYLVYFNRSCNELKRDFLLNDLDETVKKISSRRIGNNAE
ncbi:ribonuclease P protein component [Candidatus Latescibacterota bacterium]